MQFPGGFTSRAKAINSWPFVYITLFRNFFFICRTDITRDRVQRNIRREAAEAVEYLKKREAFWEILELGSNDDNNTLAVESYRSLM